MIDFGGLNVGDPACDLQPAWNVFGWALSQAVSALPYYRDSNPGMTRQASRALARVLADGPS